MTPTHQVAVKRPGKSPVLTTDIVEVCRQRLESANSPSMASLAREFGVHPNTMRTACKEGVSHERDLMQIEPPEGMKRIPGYSGYFSDRRGGIYSIRQSDEPSLLTFGPSGKGYKVFLIADGMSKGHTAQVHDLVCTTWHGPRPTPMHRVRHIDDDRLNNSPYNLEWIGSKEIPRAGSAAIGTQHGRAKLTDDDVLEILAYAANGEQISSIARTKNVHPTTVAGIISRRTWTHVAIPETGLPTMPALPLVERRVSSGQNHGRAKLNMEMVDQIRNAPATVSNATLATQLGVHPTTIARTRSGRGWTQ